MHCWCATVYLSKCVQRSASKPPEHFIKKISKCQIAEKRLFGCIPTLMGLISINVVPSDLDKKNKICDQAGH